MERAIRNVLVIFKKSDYQIYIKEHGDPHITALLEQEEASVQKMLRSHQENEAAFEHVRSVLKDKGIRSRWVYRASPQTVEGFDLVVAIGGDGTLLEAARKMYGSVPLLGVNSSPSSSVGHLLATDAAGFEETLEQLEKGTLPQHALSRIEVLVDGEPIRPWALNDVLFSHQIPAATTRYQAELGSYCELQRSSGVWISTATGSTAAIRSAGGERMESEDARLQFLVREMYPLPWEPSPKLGRGFVEPDESLILVPRMRKAILFFDGPWVRHSVHYGQRLAFRRASEPLLLYGFLQQGG
ncbi:MAG: NAD(+)/NADH kinase [Myxococcales bacterium]|nr:NAD(+)/NADH kinase [Myxococcales bacterium]